MRNHFVLRFLPVLFCLFFVSNAVAQSQLERISNAARSDGKGYVVRYHLSAPVDSFDVLQPAPDLIQMVLYKDDMDTTGISMPDQSQVLKDVRLYDLGYGYGVDIYLNQDDYFKANAYLDQNKKDVLVALTETPQQEVERYSHQFLARNWYEEIADDALEVSPPPSSSNTGSPYSEGYNNVKDKLRFDKVVIDPGHGGWDPGSIGYKGVKEKHITLAVAKKLGAYIEEHLPDVEVVYTRDDDSYLGLAELGHFANLAEGDLYVSIHCNAFSNPRVHGSEVYFLGLHKSDASFEVMKRENSVFKNEVDEELTEEDLLVYELAHSGYIATSEKIAYMIEDQFKNRAQRKSRGVKQAGFQVLFEASMPAVLVELGFISNPAEQRFLTSDYGQSIMASALFRAIRNYKVEYEEKQAYNKPAK
ncbi:N-acetylmuramoyl-L-alanine amidase family protein [Gracilimonas mengyeensis]|uniref:N-acetylmuramoyl-L-alanine amidase n=1 Tax=Gracilimonas mengyeensis TaxID=1302730 RepID=A0A521BCR8_9BACT|nr:N-acetylmuramoyl-L-alanine amidase [Gracilimonas mengyeensis]SMO44894.1 N-acetylmuramoyl-L-alanine amidase [Gracilimonas mengyeensis]